MAIPREQFKEAYGKLPEAIRSYLAGDELNFVAEEIGKTEGLHVDAVGVLAEILTRTLLGLVSPQELPRTLVNSLGIDEQRANAILTKTNEQVFIPLQKRVREAAQAKAEEEALEARLAELDRNSNEPVTVPDTKPAPLPPPALEYEPRAAASATLPGSPVAAPMPATPPQNPPAQPAPELVPTTYTPAAHPAVPQQHVVHAPANHQPGWHPAAAVHIFVPTHPTQPHVAPAPQEAPPAVPAQPEQPAQKMPEPAPVPRPQAPTPPPAPRTFTQDPYREPI